MQSVPFRSPEMNRGADVTLEKILPNSVESERAVLGAIILDYKAIYIRNSEDRLIFFRTVLIWAANKTYR